MKINIGHRDYGYRDLACNIDVNAVLQEMIDNQDVQIVPSYGRNFNHIVKLAAAVGAGLVVALPHSAFAAGIDLTPVDRVVNEGYWTLAKVGGLLATPFLAWAGLSLMPGTSAGRTKAKVIGFSVGGGILVVCGAPWAGHQLWNMASHAFS